MNHYCGSMIFFNVSYKKFYLMHSPVQNLLLKIQYKPLNHSLVFLMLFGITMGDNVQVLLMWLLWLIIVN